MINQTIFMMKNEKILETKLVNKGVKLIYKEKIILKRKII